MKLKVKRYSVKKKVFGHHMEIPHFFHFAEIHSDQIPLHCALKLNAFIAFPKGIETF